MTDLLQPHASAQEGNRRAQEWIDNLDKRAAVGKRHHIVPKFLLERFASSNGQLRVRNRIDGRSSVRSIGDLAVRDFYTAVDQKSELDSSLESLLSVVEGGAAQTLRRHLDIRAFARSRTFTVEERSVLDEFVATQAIRGMRTRRGIEVLTDYAVKLLNQDRLTGNDLRNTDFVPHPNEHLKMFGPLIDRGTSALRDRSLWLVHFDNPLLIIGDEPVILESEREKTVSGGIPATNSKNLLSIQSGLGFANAEAVLLPVSPSAVLMYGPRGQHRPLAVLEIRGEEALSCAEEINQKIAAAAIDWVAAHPDHAEFTEMNMPAPQPVLRVYDHGSVAAERVNSTPARRPMRRLAPSDVLEVPLPDRSPLETTPIL